MPYSSGVFDSVVSQLIQQMEPAAVLDVGVGAGRMGILAKRAFPSAVVRGIEVFAPYLEQFHEHHDTIYDKIERDAFQSWMRKNPSWHADLVIFGDVLEHFTYSEMLDALHFCIYRVRYLLAIWPTGFPQSEVHGNVAEAHVCEPALQDFSRWPIRFYQSSPVEREQPSKRMHFVVVEGMLAGRERSSE
jgi:hypothetical protein